SDYANSINVSFVIQLDKGAGTGAVTLNYYNGSTYVPVADWNSLDPCDTWIGYGDTITDSQYLISNFRIQLVSTLTGPNSVYINNVRVTNTWPVDPYWLEAELGPDVNDYPVTIGQFENYAWRLDMNDGNNIIQGAYWTFTTGYGGLLMHYRFDGSIGADLPSPITDDSGNEIVFERHEGGGSLTYGVSNPDTIGSTASADFEPSDLDANLASALFRLDPCGPSERTRDLLRLNGDYTVEMWVMPRSLSTEEDSKVWLISKRDAWALYMHGHDNFNFRGEWGFGGSTGDGTVKLGEWHHLAVVMAQDDPEEEISNIYLNGIDAGDAYGLPPADNNNPIWIGANQIADGNLEGHFDGLIDEIRIHDIALRSCAFLTGPGDPDYPICPVPRDGEQEVDPCGVVLSWTPGESATSHKVYFSSDFAKVNTFDPCAVIYPDGPDTSIPLDDLDDGTTYHWRVVELGGGGPWEGEVWSFTTTYVIAEASLRVWYELDEAVGDDAYDHSGHGFHADVENAGEGWDEGWDTDGGKWGGCLVFDNDISLEPPDGTLETLASGITVAVWLNSAIDGGGVVFGTGSETSDYRLEAAIPDDDGDVVWRAGNDSNDLMIWNDATPRAWAGDWHHLAFVKDEGAGEMYIYFDGLLADTKSGVFATLTNISSTSSFRIGCYGWDEEDYEGSMDDFRIYDRVLTDDEIAELFRGGDLDIAWGPDPYDGRADASLDANLTWYPGNNADQHKVFFGTDWDDVNDMTDPCAKLGLGSELYDPGPLELDTWYYWRIDEVNEANEPNDVWTGPVWRFKVADYINLDDFERYDSGDHRIYYAWYDQRSQDYPEATGSWLGLATPPTYPVHMGQQ
ncbi:MAG: LamG-like jellyroll fold domain-containing protein, partial [Planctomycetota bacterium]